MKFARHNLFVAIEIICLCLALMSGCVLGWGMFGPDKNFLVISVSISLAEPSNVTKAF